jgi:hypothetical protein
MSTWPIHSARSARIEDTSAMAYDPTDVDLLDLSRWLERSSGNTLVGASELEGKTLLRDQVVSRLNCSQLEAEQIVDTLCARGFVHFRRSAELPAGGEWRLRTFAE